MALSFTLVHAETDSHNETVLNQILSTKEALIQTAKKAGKPEPLFLSIWDFDGTILKGDCSEGLVESGDTIYKGLAQVSIESGFSEIYKADSGFSTFWHDYRFMEENISRWLAYPFIGQMLRGADDSAVRAVSRMHFRETLAPHYFRSSVQMIHALEKAGIETHIISASADFFVDESAPTLNLSADRFNGIGYQVESGKVTEKLIYPVTWSHGKTEKMRELIKNAEQKTGRPVYVIAGFGNSFSTDGPFLKSIATQSLPAGKPVTVMINGGNAPKEYEGLFMEVNQKEIVGK